MNGGAKFLKEMLDLFGGRINLALAAYNAGPGSIVDNKIPPYEETQEYVKAVIKYFKMYKKG